MSVNNELNMPDVTAETGCEYRRPKTSDALTMRVYVTDTPSDLPELPTAPTHVVRLSLDGLRFNHCDELNCSQRIWLQLRLGRRVTITAAEVTLSQSIKDHAGKKCFDTQVRFINTCSEFQSLVQTHIDEVIAKVCRNRREYDYVPGGLTHTAA